MNGWKVSGDIYLYIYIYMYISDYVKTGPLISNFSSTKVGRYSGGWGFFEPFRRLSGASEREREGPNVRKKADGARMMSGILEKEGRKKPSQSSSFTINGAAY